MLLVLEDTWSLETWVITHHPSLALPRCLTQCRVAWPSRFGTLCYLISILERSQNMHGFAIMLWKCPVVPQASALSAQPRDRMVTQSARCISHRWADDIYPAILIRAGGRCRGFDPRARRH